MKKGITLFFVFCLSFLIIEGCAANPGDSRDASQIRVVVTKNFGQELMLDKLIVIGEGTNALDALKQVAQVETAYGGGFVSSINGINSKYTTGQASQEDWFFYMNGVLANKGALGYLLRDGEVEQWDFRDWRFSTFIPAIIGTFPESFQYGYNGSISPTFIVFQESHRKVSEELKNKLIKLGVNNVVARR